MTDLSPALELSGCARGEEVGAYLDGELSADAQCLFETHLAECPACTRELRHQKGLLLTLDLAFSDAPALELPDNFSRLIAVRAESDLRGVRSWRGGFRALQLSLALMLGALLLLASSRSEVAPAGIRQASLAVFGLLDIGWRLLSGFGLGVLVVLRAAGRWFFQTPSPFGFLPIVLFIVTVLLLVRQVRRFHHS